MPLVRGRAPTRIAHSASLNATFASEVALIPARQRNAQSSISIITPLRAACALSSEFRAACQYTAGPCPASPRWRILKGLRIRSVLLLR